MKKFFFLSIAIFAVGCVSAQNVVPKPDRNVPEDNSVHSVSGIDVKPDFPGGLKAFYEYIVKNFDMPSQKGLNGTVFVTFVVEKDGSLSDIKVLRDIGYGTGEEAIRVLKDSPKWMSGEQNGQQVRVQYSLPIRIKT